jgi:hypothetical protein
MKRQTTRTRHALKLAAIVANNETHVPGTGAMLVACLTLLKPSIIRLGITRRSLTAGFEDNVVFPQGGFCLEMHMSVPRRKKNTLP